MIELLRFASEGWENFLITFLFLAYLFLLLVSIAGAFKPVNYSYITNIVKENRESNNYESD